MLNNKKDSVLIVDDNPEAADFLKYILIEEGYNTIVENSGTKAIEILKNKKIDIVLLDVLMPDISGIDVSKAIKEIYGEEFIPVILVTALTSQADKIRGLTYADDYLIKPFPPEELLARVRSLLRIRHLHRELYISKLKYENLYENFPHLSISLDKQKKITNCNHFFRQTFNITKENILGKDFLDLFHKDDKIVVEKFLDSLLDENTPEGVTRTISPIKSKTVPEMLLSLKAVHLKETDEENKIVIVMEDITEQIRLQNKQKIAAQQLYRSARLASIGTLAYGVAHEINNPLTAILGCSSSLLNRIKNNEPIEAEELKEYLEIINKESIRCRDIVESLSKFARDGEPNITIVNVRQCVDDAIMLSLSKSKRASLKIKNEVEPELKVKADAGRLTQVFVNILANCIDFCPPNSVVKIESTISEDI
ncbi:MAG: response regulator, partial [Chitinispirillaceae bacterium]|nr:response regulator [Chitinispirillaceae bacterium]